MPAVVVKYENQLLVERAQTHGDYSNTAVLSQRLKDVMRISEGWHHLDECQRESLEMIACKIARILSGDPNHIDSWADISGYATLVVARL